MYKYINEKKVTNKSIRNPKVGCYGLLIIIEKLRLFFSLIKGVFTSLKKNDKSIVY